MFDLESGSMIIGLMDLVFGIISILKTSITHSWNPGNEGLEILVAIAVLVASILLIIGVQKVNEESLNNFPTYLQFLYNIEKRKMYRNLDSLESRGFNNGIYFVSSNASCIKLYGEK